MNAICEKTVPIASKSFLHTIFPGGCRLPNGDLLLTMVEGSGFESSDQRLLQARSTDAGQSWQLEEAAFAKVLYPGLQPFSPTVKPTLLPDGTLIAAGYGFHRDRPEMGLSDYAEKFGRFPACTNIFLTSPDQGRSWSDAKVIRHSYDGLELSGPLMALPDGRLLAFAAPFLLNAPLQRGFALESSDGGASWQERGTFWSSPSVAPWEIRSTRLKDGRIVLVLWAFDLKNNCHLANHVVVSDDDGKSWGNPIDTGLRGQASNFLQHDGVLGILQARREGDAPGIYLTDVELCGDSVRVLDECRLYDANGMRNVDGKIEQQFANLKFGQPSILTLGEREYLLTFWSMEDNRYAVKTMRFQLER